MSHVVTRAGAAGDDRKQTTSPVKEMKKKMAANAEKEKQAAEKNASNEKQADKHIEKSAEKHGDKQAEKQNEQSTNKQSEKHQDKHAENHSDKHSEKQNKQAEKQNEKQPEKQGEKNVDQQPDKPVDKKPEKNVEKKTEKASTESVDSKGEKGEKDSKSDKAHQSNKPSLVVTSATAHNDNHAQNGLKEAMNGTSSVSPDTEDDDLKELEKDEHFPELVYEDGSDNDSFEPSSEGGHQRSLTRRSQVKNTRTPETPKPMTDKQTDKEAIVNGDDKAQENSNSTPKDTKLLKLKEDMPASDRRLRSADRHTPDIKESESKAQENGQDSVLLVVEVDDAEIDKAEDGRRKTDTNYAKSRVKVSPYRRGARVHDHTATSTAANYTGNNTTMEMDITESFTERPSGSEDPSLMDDSYIGGLKNIKGRKSYKQLKELSLKELAANRSKREAARANLSVTIESRPTGHVVGRKRRPADDEQSQVDDHTTAEAPGQKRMRLVERVFSPFIRKTVASSTPLPARRAAPIVGINTDLPLSAPTATVDAFDPETLKAPQQVNADPVSSNKRCSIQ